MRSGGLLGLQRACRPSAANSTSLVNTLVHRFQRTGCDWLVKHGNIIDEPADVLICSANVSLDRSARRHRQPRFRPGFKRQNRYSRLPSHHRWLQEICLPALRQALSRPAQAGESRTTQWLHAFRNCPADILHALASMVEEAWPALSNKARISTLQFFADLPEYAPSAIVKMASGSKDYSF